MSIRLFWDFYRSKDMGKRKLAGEMMNLWGFLWIGIGVGGFALGVGYGILEPVFKNALISNSSKIVSVVAILAIGAWIYWAIKTILGK